MSRAQLRDVSRSRQSQHTRGPCPQCPELRSLPLTCQSQHTGEGLSTEPRPPRTEKMKCPRLPAIIGVRGSQVLAGGPPRNCRGGWYSRPSIGRWRWMCVLAAPAPWTPGAYRMDMDIGHGSKFTNSEGERALREVIIVVIVECIKLCPVLHARCVVMRRYSWVSSE